MRHSIRHFIYIAVAAVMMLSPSVVLAQSYAAKTSSGDQKKETYVLTAAYPNPFNPTTSFSLTVHQKQDVKVEIYNMLGQPVKRLFNGEMEAGETRSFSFDAGDLPAGIYLYRAQGEQFTAARQVTLLK